MVGREPRRVKDADCLKDGVGKGWRGVPKIAELSGRELKMHANNLAADLTKESLKAAEQELTNELFPIVQVGKRRRRNRWEGVELKERLEMKENTAKVRRGLWKRRGRSRVKDGDCGGGSRSESFETSLDRLAKVERAFEKRDELGDGRDTKVHIDNRGSEMAIVESLKLRRDERRQVVGGVESLEVRGQARKKYLKVGAARVDRIGRGGSGDSRGSGVGGRR